MRRQRQTLKANLPRHLKTRPDQDSGGRLLCTLFVECRYAETEAAIQALLAEPYP